MTDSRGFVSGSASTSGEVGPLVSVRAALADRPELSGRMGEIRQAERLKGLSNSVFGVVAEAGEFVLRVPAARSAGLIDRTGELHNLQLAAKAGLAVPPLFYDVHDGLMLTHRLVVMDEAPGPADLGALIAGLHQLDNRFMGRLDLQQLLSSLEATVSHAALFAPELEQILGFLSRLNPSLALDTGTVVPSHCDLSPGNILKTQEGLMLIDFEFSAMAPPAWDLAYALLENGLSGGGERLFLAGYEKAGGILPGLEHLRAMKQCCDAVSALWALEQASIGNARTDFPAFARERIHRMQARASGL